MDIANLISFAKILSEKISLNSRINETIEAFQTNLNAYRANPVVHAKKFAKNINAVKDELAFLNVLDDDEKKILNIYGLENYISDEYWRYFQHQLSILPQDSVNMMTTFVDGLNKLKTRIDNFYDNITPLESVCGVDNESNYFEIVFNEGVAIENFSDGKEQINNWWHIVDGYAHLFGVRREDFEILSISKNSPARIRVKTTILIVSGILTITKGLLEVEKAFIGNRIMIEQLKLHPLTEGDEHDAYIRKSEESLDVTVQKKLDELIEKKIKEHSGNNGESPSIRKGIQTQYNFTINGGDVKFYISDQKQSGDVSEIEQAKTEILQIKDSLKALKMLSKPTDSTAEKLDGDNQTN